MDAGDEASQAKDAVEQPPTLSHGSELSPETLEDYFQVTVPRAFQQGQGEVEIFMTCTCMGIYVCIYICIYIYTYTYICIYIYIPSVCAMLAIGCYINNVFGVLKDVIAVRAFSIFGLAAWR